MNKPAREPVVMTPREIAAARALCFDPETSDEDVVARCSRRFRLDVRRALIAADDAARVGPQCMHLFPDGTLCSLDARTHDNIPGLAELHGYPR